MNADPGAAETPAVPAELTGPLPRKVRLTGNGAMSVIAAAILFLFGGVGSFNIYTHVKQLTEQETLPRAGIETRGEITRVWFAGRSHAPRVRYNFEANGANVAGEAPVPKRLLQTVEESRTLSVRYLPGKPTVNFPTDWAPTPVPGWGLLILPFILAAAAGVGLLFLLWRQKQLIALGTPVPAVVTKCSRTRSGFRVRYEFRTGEGMVTQGGGWCKTSREIGAKIWAVHLPQNPRVSRPYPLPALRAALP